MALTLEVISQAHRDLLAGNTVRKFGREGGTIGRSSDNDWCLPDEEQHVSSHHASIDFHAGRYYLIDVSMNGVYVNDSDAPVGSGRPQRLFDGDTIRIGEYLIDVKIDDYLDFVPEVDDRDRAFAEQEPEDVYDALSERVLLDHEETMRVRDFPPRLYGESLTDTVLFPNKKPARKKAGGNGAASKVAPIRPNQPSHIDSAPASGGAKDRGQQVPQGELKAFLRGLGLTHRDLGGMDGRYLMRNAGLALRELVFGSLVLQRNRAALQNIFKLEQTPNNPNVYNPLITSGSANYALRNLLTNRRTEDMPTAESIREACRDLKEHEIATVCAMRDAMEKFMAELDPEALETAPDREQKRFSLFNGGAAAKYWSRYKERFRSMTKPKKGPLPNFFGEEFVRAYAGHRKRLRDGATEAKTKGERPKAAKRV